jgi:histidinol-phosphate aminotransferase
VNLLKPKEQIVDLPVYQPGKPIDEVKREFGLDEVIKLASNENPFGPSPQVRQALVEESDNLALYPDGAAYNIRHKLAQHYGIDPERFIFGNGSDEIVQMISRAFITPGTNSVMADPTFPRYKTNIVIDGGEVREIPLQDGVHDLPQMAAAIDDQTRIVWVCNPNNPSGTYVDAAALNAFMDKVPAHVVVVLDEAYVEYVTAADFPDALELIERYPNLIVLRTFSKIYGLAGLRIGYGIARPQLTDLLNRVREPFNTSRVGQKAAVTALDDEAYRDECHRKNKAGKEQYYAAFEKLGLDYYPTEANFVMVDVGRPADEVFQPLLRQGLIVRSGEALGFPTKLRITIGTEEQNEKIIRALTNIVK